MNDYGSRGSERGNIEARGRQGFGSLLDWDPFRGFFPGTWHQMFGVEVNRREDRYEVEMAVPGFRPEDLDVSVQEGVITVNGRNERRHFTRSIALPEDVDEEKVDANVEHGMLLLTLPMLPKRKPQHISVGTGRGAQQAVTGQTTTGTTGTKPTSATSQTSM